MTPQTLVQLLEYLYTGTAFFLPGQLDVLGIVATALKLEYLSQWCSHFKMKQYKTWLPPDPNIVKGFNLICTMFNNMMYRYKKLV